MSILSLLIIKNGKCSTDIKEIIYNINNNNSNFATDVDVQIVHSSDITDNFVRIVPTTYHGIIILGGSQSLVNRHKLDYPYQYLNKLIEYTKYWVDVGMYILGICLGGQIIAESMGYQTKALGYTESGYNKGIKLIYNNISGDPFIRPNIYDKFKYVLSLHNDYADITDSEFIEIIATIVDRNDRDIPYIFKVNNTYGVQFHPEITINVLKIYCKTFTFDSSMIDYAKKHNNMIQKTSELLLNNWIDIIKTNIIYK